MSPQAIGRLKGERGDIQNQLKISGVDDLSLLTTNHPVIAESLSRRIRGEKAGSNVISIETAHLLYFAI